MVRLNDLLWINTTVLYKNMWNVDLLLENYGIIPKTMELCFSMDKLCNCTGNYWNFEKLWEKMLRYRKP